MRRGANPDHGSRNPDPSSRSKACAGRIRAALSASSETRAVAGVASRAGGMTPRPDRQQRLLMMVARRLVPDQVTP
jgi:hypothetical protein